MSEHLGIVEALSVSNSVDDCAFIYSWVTTWDLLRLHFMKLSKKWGVCEVKFYDLNLKDNKEFYNFD
jgi:hypothetical protein